TNLALAWSVWLNGRAASGAGNTSGGAMKDGFKVFDADAHVIYPTDLWSRFLDKQHRDRIGRRAPAGLDHYNPVTVDGRFSQHPTSIYGQFQTAINWTADDMVAKYGDIA